MQLDNRSRLGVAFTFLRSDWNHVFAVRFCTGAASDAESP